MLSKIFDVIVGKPFVMKAMLLGKVLEMQAPEGVLQAFKNMPAGQGGMFSEDGLKQMISQSMLPLPEDAVAVGTTWEKSAEMQAPPFGKQVTLTQYKFAGPGEANGHKVDKIDVTMDIKLEAGGMIPTPNSSSRKTRPAAKSNGTTTPGSRPSRSSTARCRSRSRPTR